MSAGLDSEPSFDFGFQDKFNHDRRVLGLLTNEEFDRYFTTDNPSDRRIHNAEPTDAVWEDANTGVAAAQMILGLIARQEGSYSGRFNDQYEDFREAIPGYNDRPILPKRAAPFRRPKTVFDFEIGCLRTDISIAQLRSLETAEELIKPAIPTLKGSHHTQ